MSIWEFSFIMCVHFHFLLLVFLPPLLFVIRFHSLLNIHIVKMLKNKIHYPDLFFLTILLVATSVHFVTANGNKRQQPSRKPFQNIEQERFSNDISTQPKRSIQNVDGQNDNQSDEYCWFKIPHFFGEMLISDC